MGRTKQRPECRAFFSRGSLSRLLVLAVSFQQLTMATEPVIDAILEWRVAIDGSAYLSSPEANLRFPVTIPHAPFDRGSWYFALKGAESRGSGSTVKCGLEWSEYHALPCDIDPETPWIRVAWALNTLPKMQFRRIRRVRSDLSRIHVHLHCWRPSHISAHTGKDRRASCRERVS